VWGLVAGVAVVDVKKSASDCVEALVSIVRTVCEYPFVFLYLTNTRPENGSVTMARDPSASKAIICGEPPTYSDFTTRR